MEKKDTPERIDYVIVSLAVLILYFLAYSYRFLDNNTLTSWYWAFQEADVRLVFIYLLLGIAAAYVFTRATFSEERPLFLFLLSFAAAALFWRSPETIIDASRYFTDAKLMAEYGVLFFLREWGHTIPAWTDLPLVPFIYGLIFKFLGESRAAIQLFNTLLFSLSVVLTCKIGERLWGKSTGFYGGFLLLGFPYIFSQVPLMLVDVPTMFFLTLTIYACIEAMERRGLRYPALAALAILLASLTKFSTWLMLSIVPVILLVYVKKDREKIKPALAITLIALPLVGGGLLVKLEVLLEQLELLRHYQQPMLSVWTESYLSTFFFQAHPLVTLAAIYSSYAAWRKKDPRYLIISWLLFLVLVINVQRMRYTLPVFPMLALMASYGLNEMKNAALRKFTCSCIVASSLVIALTAFLPFLTSISTVNLKEAGMLVNALEQETVEVYTLVPQGTIYNPAVSVPLFDLFTKKKIIYENTAVPPERERIEGHPLRFTWDYSPPPLYQGTPGGQNIIMIISPTLEEPIPPQLQNRLQGYEEHKFDTVSKAKYNYRTVVRLYVPS